MGIVFRKNHFFKHTSYYEEVTYNVSNICLENIPAVTEILFFQIIKCSAKCVDNFEYLPTSYGTIPTVTYTKALLCIPVASGFFSHFNVTVAFSIA